MVPHVANTGHSFKGAGMYYLHDKQSKTNERVVWTETLNLPTNDPEKAMGWMAHTSINASRLKRLAGVSSAGRKNKLGDVYAVSLSWHPDQQPDKETMLQSAHEILEGLGLQDHQAVIVAHNDTAHPHIHVVCNLIHPENGRKAVPSYDWLKLSAWAENLERNDGKILCEQRVENNKKRKEQGHDNKMKLVKHKEKPLDIAPMINELYQQSDSGKAFRAAVEEKGYTLAKGDRRGFVLVDEQGEIYSLARQLKGQRAKDIRQRLKDVQELPMAKELSDERKYFNRDKYETDRQKKIVDAAIEESMKKESKKTGKADKRSPKEPLTKDEERNPQWDKIKAYDDSHLKKLDAMQAWERKCANERTILDEKLEKFYGRKKMVKEIKELEKEISETKKTFINKKKLTARKEHLKSLKKTLANADWRIAEQREKLENKQQKEKPDFSIWDNDPDLTNSPNKKRRQDLGKQDPDRNNDWDLDR
jgi:hypothetical protein